MARRPHAGGAAGPSSGLAFSPPAGDRGERRTAILPKQICARCGTPNPDGATVCAHCSSPVTDSRAPEPLPGDEELTLDGSQETGFITRGSAGGSASGSGRRSARGSAARLLGRRLRGTNVERRS